MKLTSRSVQAVVLHQNLKLGYPHFLGLGYPYFFRIRVPLGLLKGEGGRVSFFTWHGDVDIGTRTGYGRAHARVWGEGL